MTRLISVVILLIQLMLITSCAKDDVVLRSENAILSFKINGKEATVVSSHGLQFQINDPADITNLTPTIEVSPGATVEPASGIPQDFTSAVTYIVTAENGTTKAYNVQIVKVYGFNSIVIKTASSSYAGEIDEVNRVIKCPADFTDAGINDAQLIFQLSPLFSASRESGAHINVREPGVIFITTPEGVNIPYAIEVKNSLNRLYSFRLFEHQYHDTMFPANAYPEDAAGIALDAGFVVRVLSDINVASVIPFAVSIPEGATTTPSVDAPIDFSTDRILTVTSQSGLAKNYTIRVIREDMLFQNDFPGNRLTIHAHGGSFTTRFQTVSAITSVTLVSVAGATSVPCSFSTPFEPASDLSVLLVVDPIQSFPAGDYNLRVTLENGRTILVRRTLRAS